MEHKGPLILERESAGLFLFMSEPNALKAISKTDDELRVGNYIVLFDGRDLTGFGKLGAKTQVYRNPDGSAGEFFVKNVAVDSDYTAMNVLPIDWEHGLDPDGLGISKDEVLGYVDWKTAKRDDKGIFVERVLNRRKEYIQWLEELIDAKMIGNSTEPVQSGVKKSADGGITHWPLKRDTLTVMPMEPRMLTTNVVAALKSLGIKAAPMAGQPAVPPAPDGAQATPPPAETPNPNGAYGAFQLNGQFFVYAKDAQGEATGDPIGQAYATPEEAKTAADELNQKPPEAQAPPPPIAAAAPQAIKGASTMPTELEELKATVASQAKDITDLKAIVAAPREPLAGGGAATPREVWPYNSLGQQLRDVKEQAVGRNTELASFGRLKAVQDEVNKATGLNEGVGSEGEFLLQPTYTAEVIKPVHEEGPFSQSVRRLPVGDNSNSGVINGVDETSRATGSRWGGIRGYRLAEAGTKTGSKPAFREINWRLKKYAVLMYATDELLQDSAQLTAILRQGGSEELRFMLNDDILNGAGTAGPLGILNSPALISVPKETGQAAATVVYQNLVKIWSRIPARNRPNITWFINSEVEPQLDQLYIAAGAGALEPRFVTYTEQGVMKIKGRPVVVNEFSAALGTVGDIVAVDLSEYLLWEKGGEQFETSIHVAFTTDETAFRLVYRVDGKTALNSAITPYKGSATQSPFVALATRA